MTKHAGRITIVTGANQGIGFETARGMAQAGFTTIMACRSKDKAEAARARILESEPGAILETMELDLSEMDSVRAFAEAFRERHERLDVLINNAGVLLYSRKQNADGIELQFATNHLGHFLLTALLIDMMPNDAASRVVALGSLGHKGARIHFDDLTCDGDGLRAYEQSKMACLMFGDELNRRLKAAGSKVVSLTAHPGGSDSGLFEEMGRLQYAALKLLSPLITHSNASAAKPSLHAALDASVAGGDYYGPQGFMEMRGKVGVAKRDPYSMDVGAARRLWAISEELTSHSFDLSASNPGPDARERHSE